eukprot:CAMPEP_0196815424 /NCGR_PEP_ID=MMETSP1362-20130617/49672_1 /TAXON_ID=163516 /ORGANISM="Leptocylindrus danicus, Strain CCMP1856" /LENGTH=489 /DNA_ID=CAMNT_0042192373 /DNA_START=8 /DNA_END=1477 /DNA_ORIENTATION=+
MMKKAPIRVLLFLAVTDAFTTLHRTNNARAFSQTRANGQGNDTIERFWGEDSIFDKFTKQQESNEVSNALNKWKSVLGATAMSVMLNFWVPDGNSLLGSNQIANAADGAKIAKCLFQKCPLQLGKCIANPNCLANVICINTCNGRPDESECQIECGNTFENEVVGEFNKCAVSDMDCVPQKQDDGSYPIPAKEKTVQNFDATFFEGKMYITAGQNKLFDVFPCQVHFFTNTAPGKFFGKLNWRINEPDGEFFTRDALQRFVQDENWPAHLINHDNDYLHYEDDWYILDYEMPGNSKNVPPFAFVYYRGSNDAWVGYGGAVVYTPAASLPEELIPRLREAAQKVNFDFDKDFTITDNTCQVIGDKEKILLREQFAGKVAIQTEQQLQAEVVRVRGTATNNIKAQKMLVNNELGQASAAFEKLSQKAKEFEEDIVKDAVLLEKELEKDLVNVEKEVEKDIVFVEKEVEKDIMKVEKEVETDIKKVIGGGKK